MIACYVNAGSFFLLANEFMCQRTKGIPGRVQVAMRYFMGIEMRKYDPGLVILPLDLGMLNVFVFE